MKKKYKNCELYLYIYIYTIYTHTMVLTQKLIATFEATLKFPFVGMLNKYGKILTNFALLYVINQKVEKTKSFGFFSICFFVLFSN